MEGEQYYSEAHIRNGAYRDGRYYATTSFRLEIPPPYFSWAEYSLQHPTVDYNNAIRGVSFLANNCVSQNNREQLVQPLIQQSHWIRVVSIHNVYTMQIYRQDWSTCPTRRTS
jgi:hypothetical protein